MTPSAEFLNPLKPDFKFDSKRAQELLQQGLIDESDSAFLQNLANESAVSPEVVQAVYDYRMLVGNDFRPGQDLFIRMQKLGLKNHPLTGLDISGYNLPSVDLSNASIDGDLNMRKTVVDKDVNQTGMNVRNIYQLKMKAEIVHQQGMKAAYVDQSEMKAEHIDQSGMEADHVDQSGMEARSIDQSGMKVRYVDQHRMDVGYVDQSGMRAEIVDQQRMRAGYVDQHRMDAGHVDQQKMKAEIVRQPGMKAKSVNQEGMDVKKIIKD